MAVITDIEDLRLLARRRVPRMFYEYLDAGSWTEGTYRANACDLQRIKLRQRVGIDIGRRSTRSRMVGQEVAMPVALAPTGLTGMQHADGEMLAARAAMRFGVPFALSTMSICSIEDVARATNGHPFWFQLYVMKDRDFIERLIVSNHGGRQLDGADSAIRALPRIVRALGGRIEVHMDSGIRSGQDVLRARALGATGTYIGRAFVYGLGAMGEAGVTRALEIIHKELDLTMAMCGHTDIDHVDARVLVPGTF